MTTLGSPSVVTLTAPQAHWACLRTELSGTEEVVGPRKTSEEEAIRVLPATPRHWSWIVPRRSESAGRAELIVFSQARSGGTSSLMRQQVQRHVDDHVLLSANHLATAQFKEDLPCIDPVSLAGLFGMA